MTGVAVPAGGLRVGRVTRAAVLTVLARAQLVVAATFTVVSLILVSLAGPHDVTQPAGWPRVAVPLATFELSVVGFLIARRHARNPIGWIFALAGVDGLVGEVAKQYANVGLEHGQGSLPGVESMAWLAALSAISTAFPILTFGFLLFPDGHLPSRRWRPVAWLAAAALATVMFIVLFTPGPLSMEFRSVENPYGIEGIPPDVANALAHIGLFSLFGCVLASVTSMFLRLRRNRGDERQQVKWVTYAACLVGVETIASVLWSPEEQSGNYDGPVVITILALAFLVAMVKFRLYDIDIVISKTVVFGLLAGFIATVYLAVVVGLGLVIGSRGRPDLALSILGAVAVAAAFQPARERVERLAKRLVYGDRAAPYEVLARFCERLTMTYPSADVLPRMARLLAEGTGVARAEVWLRSEDRLRRVACWPEGAGGGQSDGTRSRPHSVPVHHLGDALGSLIVYPRPGSPLRPLERRLLTDLAAQAGLILRNARLVEALRRSRTRLVTARDAERRRLGRDLRGSVESRLARVATALAAATAHGDEGERRMVEALRAETEGALTDLRDLARGIYPPSLVAQGLVAALASQLRTSPVPVDVRAESVGRYPPDIEAAAYFCCLEALQNVSKHGRAGHVVLSLSGRRPGRLVFSVDDDGVGFTPSATLSGAGLQNIADRAAALGGEATVTSVPGRGTSVAGWLPTRAQRTQR